MDTDAGRPSTAQREDETSVGTTALDVGRSTTVSSRREKNTTSQIRRDVTRLRKRMRRDGKWNGSLRPYWKAWEDERLQATKFAVLVSRGKKEITTSEHLPGAK